MEAGSVDFPIQGDDITAESAPEAFQATFLSLRVPRQSISMSAMSAQRTDPTGLSMYRKLRWFCHSTDEDSPFSTDYLGCCVGIHLV